MSDTPAIAELKNKLQELDAHWAQLSEERRSLEDRQGQVGEERDAIRVAIGSLEGSGGATAEGEAPPLRPPDSPRPSIRDVATRLAQENGGIVKVRALLSETQRYGFKSDAGGLHTSLKGMPAFEHSGPGEFTHRAYRAVVESLASPGGAPSDSAQDAAAWGM